MKDQIQNSWLKMEAAKANFISVLETWDEPTLSKSVDGGWSALQVAEHLIASETGTLEYLKKKTQAPASSINESGETEAEASRRLNLALKSDQKWEAPQVLPPPTGDYPLKVLLSTWSDLRRKWKYFLDELPDEYYDRAVFKHPLAGRLNLDQTLAFVEHHIQHHVHQLRRIAEHI